jgi:lysophospholipase L1-like esterase
LQTFVIEVLIKFICWGDPFWIPILERSNRKRKHMKRIKLKLAAVIFAAAILSLNASAGEKNVSGHWVSAWSTAVHAPLPFPGLPPAPIFENQTIRMVVRPTIGGQRLRIRLSNAFGTSAVTIGSAHIALVESGAKISPESDHALTFAGEASVKVPPGAPVLSDPVDLKVSPFAEVAVSLFLPVKTPASSTHFWAQHETYISEPGDLSAKAEIANPTVSMSWYWLADVEVWSVNEAAAIVTLGDSITDGVGAKQGEYSDWPDQLAKRLSAESGSGFMAVVNEGIGGNRILYDGAGISALARFDRDVLAQPGITALIVLEGINDIGWPNMKPPVTKDGPAFKESPFVAEAVTAKDLIMGLQQIADRAHEHGIRAFGATLTPFEGADYFSKEGETTRQEVNQWIRTSGTFDGVFDFDAAVRDPNHPSQFREGYHSGDHLHPSAAGYKAMANVIDISLLRKDQH